MKQEHTKKPLYRKENKTAWNFHRNSPGGYYSDERHSKSMQIFEGQFKSMRRTKEGFDYTPLFKFLLSKVGQDWDTVHSEATSRLDQQAPIFWMVDMNITEDDDGVVRLGESAYYSKLTIKDGLLIIANEQAIPPTKRCTCCTYTFNGKEY